MPKVLIRFKIKKKTVGVLQSLRQNPIDDHRDLFLICRLSLRTARHVVNHIFPIINRIINITFQFSSEFKSSTSFFFFTDSPKHKKNQYSHKYRFHLDAQRIRRTFIFMHTIKMSGNTSNRIIMICVLRKNMLEYMYACSAKASIFRSQMSEVHHQSCTSNSWPPSLCTHWCMAQWESHHTALEVVRPRGESGREHCFEPMGFETLKNTGEVMGYDFLRCFHASPDEQKPRGEGTLEFLITPCLLVWADMLISGELGKP